MQRRALRFTRRGQYAARRNRGAYCEFTATAATDVIAAVALADQGREGSERLTQLLVLVELHVSARDMETGGCGALDAEAKCGAVPARLSSH